MDRMINYILLVWKLAHMLRTYRTCNSTIWFLKYEFNNRLLDGVTKGRARGWGGIAPPCPPKIY